MLIESFIKISGCFSYILKFTFIASDKINDVGGVVINIVQPAGTIHLYNLLVVALNILLTGMNLF